MGDEGDRSMIRRRLLHILAFLLAGAAVNVAVARGCAAFVSLGLDNRSFGQLRFGETVVAVFQFRGFGATRIYSSLESYDERTPALRLPQWSSARRVPEPWRMLASVDGAICEDARGWPFRSMKTTFQPVVVTTVARNPGLSVEHGRVTASLPDGSSRTLRSAAWGDGVHAGVRLPERWSRGAADPWIASRFIPLQPLYRGFVANTLFYAVVLWTFLRGPGVARRHLRRRRNLCPECAYPVGARSVCTECGTAVATPSG